MTSVYDLSWNKTSFLAKLLLFFKSWKQEGEKMRSKDPQVRAGGYSALSSTYYSIVGTANAQLKAALCPRWAAPAKVVGWGLTWLPLAAWCYWRMLPLSNRIVKLIGYDGMSADECDIRQSVLLCRGGYEREEEAKDCIRAALKKQPQKAHTRGLLRVGLMRIYLRQRTQFCNELLDEAIADAREAEQEDPRQAARIYRHCADIIIRSQAPDWGGAERLLTKATELAQDTGAQDQLLKLRR